MLQTNRTSKKMLCTVLTALAYGGILPAYNSQRAYKICKGVKTGSKQDLLQGSDGSDSGTKLYWATLLL